MSLAGLEAYLKDLGLLEKFLFPYHVALNAVNLGLSLKQIYRRPIYLRISPVYFRETNFLEVSQIDAGVTAVTMKAKEYRYPTRNI